MVRSDPGLPRITCYDDDTGERVELSARVLANWVAKAADLLDAEAEAGPGTSVGLDLPAHWRSAYWALAAWSTGATLVLGSAAGAADVVVTDDHGLAAAAAASDRVGVLVTLAALARAGTDVPDGVIDEAADVASHADHFEPVSDPGDQDVAIRAPDGDTSYGQLVAAITHPPGVRARVPDDLEGMLRSALPVWAADGSIVLLHNALGDPTERLASEQVILDLT